MKKENLNNRLRNILQQIYKLDVALENDHSSKKHLLMSFLKNFREYCFQKSPIFKKYFREFYLTGSYFEGLRVKEATEFDINVAFNFPFSESSYVVNELDELPSYATIKLKKANEDFKSIPYFDSKGFLIGKNILKWFQSLLDSFLNSPDLQYPDGVLMIKTSNSGPARTIKVFYESVWISIDLVPVFPLNAMTHLKKLKNCGNNHQMSKEMETCYIVPKPLKPEQASVLSSHMSEQVWRIHFPEAEKIILENKTCLKRVIQLVKALRDKEDWPLPSYFLKVVAFWMVKKYPKEDFCDKQNVGSLFILFLKCLEQHLAKKHLGHIFYPSFNLFHGLHKTLLKNLQLRVRKVIHQLKANPNSAFTLFKIMITQPASLPRPLLVYRG